VDDAPYVLTIWLVGIPTPITLACESFEISEPGADEHGHPTPLRLDYEPVAGWNRTLGYLSFNAVAAIEVERQGDEVGGRSADGRRAAEVTGDVDASGR